MFLGLIPDQPKKPNYITASGSNSILDQLTHLRAQGIYQSGGVPDSATEQSQLLRNHSKYPSIRITLPPSFCVLYCKQQIVHGISISYFICFLTMFPDVETNQGPRRPVCVCRLLCSNISGLAGNLRDLTVASSRYDRLLCFETLVSDMRHLSELLVPGFGCPVLLCRGRMRRPQGWRHMYEMDMQHFTNPSLSVVVAKCWFLGFVVRPRTYICSVFSATLTQMTGFFTVY